MSRYIESKESIRKKDKLIDHLEATINEKDFQIERMANRNEELQDTIRQIESEIKLLKKQNNRPASNCASCGIKFSSPIPGRYICQPCTKQKARVNNYKNLNPPRSKVVNGGSPGGGKRR